MTCLGTDAALQHIKHHVSLSNSLSEWRKKEGSSSREIIASVESLKKAIKAPRKPLIINIFFPQVHSIASMESFKKAILKLESFYLGFYHIKILKFLLTSQQFTRASTETLKKGTTPPKVQCLFGNVPSSATSNGFLSASVP